MHKRLPPILLALLLFVFSFQSDALHRVNAQSKIIPEPKDVLGFTPGDDRKLASWAKVVEYFQKLAAASDRVKFEEIGKSTMGAPFVYATISAPENLARLDTYKDIQRRLADPRTLGRGARAEVTAEGLISNGKTIVVITCGIHSTEVGSYLSSMLIAYRLASSNEPEVLEILKNTIILLVPSTNPDGVDIVNNWYQKTLGTPYEGTDPPELYHKYTGHDDNRDWYAFTQVETQLVVDKILNVWHPQIVHDIHQQGAFGSRLFLPPYMQPVEPNVPKQIVEGYTELGNYLAKEIRASGYKGITTDSTYDAWSPSRAYSHYHGGVRILQESASCRLATPITVKFEQLQSREGYDPQKESANFGPLWKGGEWHLRDITNQMTTVAFLLLKHAAQNREHWLQKFYEIEKEAVRPRRRGELQALVIAPSDSTQRYTGPLSSRASDFVLNMLQRADVEVHSSTPFIVAGRKYPMGTAVIPMNQPYSAFARAVLRPQPYPDMRDGSGRPIPPYDVTAHDLSLLTGVAVEPISTPFRYSSMKTVQMGINGGCGGPNPPRRAIYKSRVPTMDEGWTRWVLDRQGCTNYISLEDKAIRHGDLIAKFDTIIIPDQPRAPILNGHLKGTMPDEYTGGLWLLGADRIKGKAALVEVTMGKGRIILFGFRPQYRGQSLATYPLFFNAITSNEVSTIRVSGWVKASTCRQTSALNPPADAGGTDLITAAIRDNIALL